MSEKPQNTPNSGEQEPEEKPAFSRTVALVILAVVVIGAAVAGTVYYLHARQYESTDDASIDGNIIPVSAKTSGRILEVPVSDNQEVAQGQVLVRLDPQDIEQKVAQAQAAYDAATAKLEVAKTEVELVVANTAAITRQAEANLEQAKAAVTAAQSQLASAQADVAAAQAEATRREQDLKRFESLDPRVVTQQQLDLARSAAQTARAGLDAAQKHVLTAQSAIAEAQAQVASREAALAAAHTAPQQIASAQAQVRSAEAALGQAKASLESARNELSYTVVKAPIAGRVARKMAQPGQYAQYGQTMMALVPADVWVTANFKETQITRMREGQEVDISVDAYPGRHFAGKVQSIQAGTGSRFSLLPPENATGNYVKVVQRVPVKIVFDGKDHLDLLLAPGMSVEPRVHISIEDEVHPAPIGAGTSASPALSKVSPAADAQK